MSIYAVLRHRARLSRATTVIVSGSPQTSWTALRTVRCLLSVTGVQPAQAGLSASAQSALDREGLILFAPGEDVRPTDRLDFTRGATGRWSLGQDVKNVSTLETAHHKEFRASEVK